MNTKLAIISALAPLSISAAFALTSTAKAQGQLADACFGSTKAEVVSCCAAFIRSNGMPLWMERTGATCGTVAACKGGGGGGDAKIVAMAFKPKKCSVQVSNPDIPSGKTPPAHPSPSSNYKP